MARPVAGEWIADFLVRYLNTSTPNPLDFGGYVIKGWGESEGVRLSEKIEPKDLDEASLQRFARWLQTKEALDLIHNVPWRRRKDIPSYVHMTDAVRLPKGSWLIHFTHRNPFATFDRGATLETPLWSTGVGNTTAPEVSCPYNLARGRNPGRVVFGYALSLSGESFREKHFYGDNAVLFRSDLAVDCYHAGDRERQVIFPICSEYDVIPILEANDYGGGVVRIGEEDRMFATANDIVRALGRKPGLASGSRQVHRYLRH